MSLNLNIKETASFTRPAHYDAGIEARHTNRPKTWNPVMIGLVAFAMTFCAALGALLVL